MIREKNIKNKICIFVFLEYHKRLFDLMYLNPKLKMFDYSGFSSSMIITQPCIEQLRFEKYDSRKNNPRSHL